MSALSATTDTTTAMLVQAGITITVLATPETDNAYKSLADCMSKSQIRRLLEKADTNVWHWAAVEVLAEYTDDNGTEYEARDYLGACSYKSRQDFIKNSGYYADMLQTVTEDIMQQLAAAQPRAFKDFYTPDIIQKENRADAYYHSMSPEDVADIVRRTVSDPTKAAEVLATSTHMLSRCTDINGEVWATSDKKPLRPNALYYRIK